MAGGKVVKAKQVLMVAAISGLTGCGSLSGYDGTSKFACSAPRGVACMSMSGVNANMDAGTIGSTRTMGERNDSRSKADGDYGDAANVAHVAIKSGMPIRTLPRKMRVWWAPWEDSDGDLNDQSYSYMVIDNGHWVIERVRSGIVQQFMPSSASSATSPLKVGNAMPTASTPKPPPTTLGKRQDASSPVTVNAAASKFPEFEIMKKGMPDAN
jgi:conjugal transfer pilus assembly protein TraV